MSEDKLKLLLSRVNARLERDRQQALKKRLKKKWERKAAENKAISEDFTQRLLDRGRFRALLSDSRLDSERFRWYAARFMGGDLDSIRAWIDSRMSAEEAKSIGEA